MTSPEVTYTTVDTGPQKLWYEWLSGYFDGAGHEIVPGRGTFSFPKASLVFDQSAMTQPMAGSGVCIGVVGETLKSDSSLVEEGKWVDNEMRWDFFVRASNIPAGGGNAAYACRQATDLLRGLLMNDYAVKPLAQKGLFDLRVDEAAPIESNLYQIRRLRVRGKLSYDFYTVST